MISDFKPQKIYIDEDVSGLPLSKKVQLKFPDLVEIIDKRTGIPVIDRDIPANHVWHLSRHKGKISKALSRDQELSLL